jgi:4-hydroxybenzoate polyprenyltransferase
VTITGQSTFGGLVRAAHAGPCVAVTTLTTVLAVEAGNSAATCVVVAAALLSGQLLIGWTNDRLDVGADTTAGRTEKPLVDGDVSLHTLDRCRLAALVAVVVLSLLLGWRAGLLHLFAVGCGLAYDYRLKRTWLSFLPYALAFGALPGIATLARPDHALPAGWAVLAAALLGVAANLTNALPDLAADRLTGVNGLPNRLGARWSMALAIVLLVAATASIAFGPPGPPTWSGWTGLALTIVIALGCVPALWNRAAGKAPFYAVIALAGIDVVMIVLAGSNLG